MSAPSTHEGPAIRVTGHRGARDLAPENTLRGFALALSLGCHAVELDVQLTRDGRLAVIHDATLDRTTSGEGLVSEHTLDQLQGLDAGGGERIPSLEEILVLLRPSHLSIQIELKGAGTEHLAPGVVQRMDMTKRVRFTSFFHLRLLAARELAPDVRTGVLVGSNPVDPVHLLRSAGANSIHVMHTRIDHRIVQLVHENGDTFVAMGRIVDVDTVDRLVGLGVDEIGSDRPDLVIERLKHHASYQSPP